MPTAASGHTIIEYDTFGSPDDEALLLVMGLGTQMTAWDPDLCRLLADRGRYVIRFDNRDCGLSSKTEGDPPNVMALMMAARSGQEITIDVPYTLSDMAGDAVALLDHLGIDRAHVVGASMGGMIAQHLAIEHPTRVRSLTSIMSTTGNPGVGQAEPATVIALLAPPPTDREAAIDQATKSGRLIAGPHFDAQEMRSRAAAAYDRSHHPKGVAFQLAAIAKSGDRTEALRSLALPTLVIHGQVDPLVGVSGGQATAEAIPGAELLVFDDMGHDLPEVHWGAIVDAITALA